MRTNNGYYVQDNNGTNANPPVTNIEASAAKNVTWDGTYIKFGTNYLVYDSSLKIKSYTSPPTTAEAKWRFV